MSEQKKNDGGQAFPTWDRHAFTGDPTDLTGGISMRDYFAAAALTGLLAHNWTSRQKVCEEAFAIADDMLKELEK